VRRRAAAASILSASAVLAVSWLLGTQSQTDAPVPASADTTGGARSTRSTGSTGGTAAGTTGTATGSAAASGTFTGSSVGTRFGDVQVQIAVANGSITDVIALHLTDADGRSVQISNRAAPVLRQEVLSAQSADVQMVSGATYTSEAYLTSLQSAIDQAGL
jgi:uncharacterized protein with FMN-binding domain